MKISELIKALEKIQAESGDLPVVSKFVSGGHGYPDCASSAKPQIIRACKDSYFGYVPIRQSSKEIEYVVQV